MIADQRFVHLLGIIGVGNTLAGDDGAGNAVVSRLKEKYPDSTDVFLHNLETDPLELWDVLPSAKKFIFVDAVAGKPAGRLVAVSKRGMRRAWAPSLHNMDLPTVIRQLYLLRGEDEPEWNIWGVTIDIPDHLQEGLSSAVSEAVESLVEILSERIESEDYSVEVPIIFEQFENT
ncbi:MAG: hydrogenase maturation protease [Candidatus Aegiribacteria sp.]|nr:hydrogenase maturation protease [Candidatus Aegiribacteria sp.]